MLNHSFMLTTIEASLERKWREKMFSKNLARGIEHMPLEHVILGSKGAAIFLFCIAKAKMASRDRENFSSEKLFVMNPTPATLEESEITSIIVL